jgi:hypothetical protein
MEVKKMKIIKRHPDAVAGKSVAPFFNRERGNGFFHSGRMIARSPDTDKEKPGDEKKLAGKLLKAMEMLGSAGPHLGTPGQQELLESMTEIFAHAKQENLGLLGADKRRIRLGRPMRLNYTFQRAGSMSVPFEYRLHVDLSHETEGGADAYFRHGDDYGGFMVFRIERLMAEPVERIAIVLSHESVHMLSHLQRAVQARVGEEAAAHIPGEKAAGLLDASGFASFKAAFAVHFGKVKDFLNGQEHRRHSLDKLPSGVVDDWTRKVVEETIAYVYGTRIDQALEARKGKPTVTLAFEPLSFLKRYMTEQWLNDPADQAAMEKKEGKELLEGMKADMLALAGAVEAQVGAFGKSKK